MRVKSRKENACTARLSFAGLSEFSTWVRLMIPKFGCHIKKLFFSSQLAPIIPKINGLRIAETW
jgi:hypothetical protein